MAVIDIWPEGGGTAEDDDKGGVHLVRLFGVRLDNPATAEIDILNDIRLPQPFHPHPLSLASLVVRRTWQQNPQDPWFGKVVVRYSTEYRKPDEAEPNPLLRAPKIRWTTEVVQRAVTTDKDGAAIITASKETYDPPPTQPVRILVLNFQRNYQIGPTDANQHFSAYLDCTNETAWYGFLPDVAYMAEMEWEPSEEAGIQFIIESLVIKMDTKTLNDGISPDTDAPGKRGVGWNLRPLHRGFWKIVAGPARELILDASGRQPPEPSLLDASGGLLAIGGTPVFRNHRIFDRAEFNDLGLQLNN